MKGKIFLMALATICFAVMLGCGKKGNNGSESVENEQIDTAKIIESRQPIRDSLIKTFTISETDEFSEAFSYTSNKLKFVPERKLNVFPLLEQNKSSKHASAQLYVMFCSDDWLLIDRMDFLIDGVKYDIPLFMEVSREVFETGYVWEHYIFTLKDDVIDAILKSNEVSLKVYGEKGSEKYKYTQEELEGFKDVLKYANTFKI